VSGASYRISRGSSSAASDETVNACQMSGDCSWTGGVSAYGLSVRVA
jgi:hypothetical protein